MRKRGEITVFLSLMMAVMSAFFITLSGAAQKLAARSEAAYAVDCAVRSCFAEYNKELYETYGVLLIDSSFKMSDGGIENIEDHFSMYLASSLTVNELVEAKVYESTEDVRVAEEYIFDHCGIGGEELDDLVGYMRENDSPGFDPGNCFHALSFSVTLKDPLSEEYTVTREYAYDHESM